MVTLVGDAASTPTVPLTSVLSVAVKLATTRLAGSKSMKYVPVVAKLVASKWQLPSLEYYRDGIATTLAGVPGQKDGRHVFLRPVDGHG